MIHGFCRVGLWVSGRWPLAMSDLRYAPSALAGKTVNPAPEFKGPNLLDGLAR